ncbi:bifunctional phosphopantothenoylcysteine decarboxylase/phosphopantothenate synthase [Calidifontibacter sp. DB0510]|uniref:Coenzyme A biosynthesis bifunctional protein CoaBC n=1 Tax=Metallococcus carri TaxID=1656884 RepID=A0A967EGF5_9MICO|nr:bifunctional phosphopantothenoylcysteine decarboxylase/phosphopantothenate synthase [Metallococcus carri]NHN55008.1 bifunctional phosphopantothenoylcysteine decarboxylase/phosphopantothenate synthase [Metallococcus carri]NOP37354.1 bifunctional phosphopantothenoylcysteine decarboxylase/phosphopantothenate synthase [Calidifontibacter sp. DB2511S]
MRIVLGVGGGIAAYKAATLLRLFSEAGHEVTVVPTAAALHFVGAPTWAALSGRPAATEVWDNVHEVPHVRLGQQADLVVVAPATADLLARAAHGMADDLLTNTLLTARCPVVLAPAMHTEMWLHPATVANVATLRERGVDVLDPASGRLTGADTGPGRLPEPQQIFEHCARYLGHGGFDAGLASSPLAQPAKGEERASSPLALRQAQDSAQPTTSEYLAGRRVVVTAGGTREAIDPVRFIGNRSSGKQGYAVAREAARRGAQVTLISTVDTPAPEGCDLVPVESAEQLREAVLSAGGDVIVMAAAVADFRPATPAASKIKKGYGADDPDAPVIELVRNPDILADLVAARGGERTPYIVGFAAETGDADGDVLTHAREKLARKGCDLLVANEVGDGVTFGQDDSTVYLLRPGTDEVVTVGPASKDDIAAAIWDITRVGLSRRI